MNGLNVWIGGWRRNKKGTNAGTEVDENSLTLKTGELVKNEDIWKQLAEAKKALEEANVRLKLNWVKGHSGDIGNEAADRLAVAGIHEVPRSMRKSFSGR